MSPYGFYAATLRFVATKTDRADPRVADMMAILNAAAASIDADGQVVVAPDRLDQTARAFAGVAGFLQKQILPETVAHGHADAERQIRWSVDAAMDAVNMLLRESAARTGNPVTLTLPPPPV